MRDTRTQNFFPLPNQIFNLGLESGEILVYSYLMYCEDRKTYKCHPSYRTIGESIGMSINTVKKYVAGLEKKRLITTEPTMVKTKDGRYHNGSLEYTIRPIQNAVDYYEDIQMQQLLAEHARANTQRALEEFDRKHKNTIEKGQKTNHV